MKKIEGWRVAILTWIISLLAAGNEAIAYLDKDPETVFNQETFLVGLTGIGLGFVARIFAKAKSDSPRKLVVMAAACLMLTGCSLWPGKVSAEANLGYWQVVEPRYRRYLKDDEALNEKQRKILNDTVDGALNLARDMVKEAK